MSIIRRSKFFKRQTPLDKAARTSARFEMLLEPGVAIDTGLLEGVPATTEAASERVFLMTSSGITVASLRMFYLSGEEDNLFGWTRILLVDLHYVEKSIWCE